MRGNVMCRPRLILWTLLLAAAGLVDSVEAQTTTYIHTDGLGSVVAESDASGKVIRRYFYDPYGAAVDGQVLDSPGYTGHVSDSSTGLSYMQQRYMDPQLGVFLSVDPVTAYSKPVEAFNRYWYANSNPYRFTDPDGRASRDLEYIYKYSGAKPPPSDATFADVIDDVAKFINPFTQAAECHRDGCGAAGWTIAAVGVIPEGKVASMARFLKTSQFGGSISRSITKTSHIYDGQAIYRVTGKVDNSMLSKGDYFYLDAAHRNHMEVFDRGGKAKGVLNLDGSTNYAKTEKALEEGRRIYV